MRRARRGSSVSLCIGAIAAVAIADSDLIIAFVRLILASGSPRRAELLRAAGYAFEIVAPEVDESIRAGEAAAAYVRRLAAEKSAAAREVVVARGFQPREGGPALRQAQGTPSSSRGERAAPHEVAILGADTVVVVDGDILGKPRDEGEAAAMLRRLSGRPHVVMTGVSLRQGPHELGRVVTTDVYVRDLSQDDLEWYVASGEGRDKAGGYAIQGLASRFIPRIDGSYSNVVGLPVACVAELLTSLLASNG
jgi:septum formation protein